MADERSPFELTRAIDRIEADIRQIRADYLRRDWLDVYRAERDADRTRIKRIEDGTRSWLYGVGIAVIGALCGAVAQILITRGH